MVICARFRTIFIEFWLTFDTNYAIEPKYRFYGDLTQRKMISKGSFFERVEFPWPHSFKDGASASKNSFEELHES